jgi:hypothetical protein
MTIDYYWFDAKATAKIAEKIAAAGTGARLRILPKPNDKIMAQVVDAEGKSHDPINDSHLCPPECD